MKHSSPPIGKVTEQPSHEDILKGISSKTESKKPSKISREDADFGSDCASIVAHPGLGIIVLPTVIACIVTIFVFWAANAELEEVTRGSGRVIPSKPIQVIQSLEGGIVNDIKVEVGQSVKKGEVLMQIRDEIFSSQYRENMARREMLAAKIVRLKAEAYGEKELVFPPELKAEHIEIETALFEKRQLDYQVTLEGLEARLKLAERESQFIANSGGAVSKLDKIQAEREIALLDAEIKTLQSKSQRESMEQFDQFRGELHLLDLAILRDKDRLDRTSIKSPVSGTVNTLNINSVGRVIGSGEEIMEIVPVDESLLVEVNIQPSDIAFIRLGHEATVKFTAYDFSIYGGLKGTVEHISADTIADEESNEVFQIKVRTHSTSLGKNDKGKDLAMLPGMVAEVDILTGKKTVLDYLMKPINRARQRAFRER